MLNDVHFVKAHSQLVADRSLGNRWVSKYFVGSEVIPTLLQELQSSYALLTPDRVSSPTSQTHAAQFNEYRTTYLDTPELRFFHDHRRGRWPRHKVRFRHHQTRKRSWLEVKRKRGGGVATKARQEIDFGRDELAPEDEAFLNRELGPLSLRRKVMVGFERLTLLHRECPERITIDRGLQFQALDTETDALLVRLPQLYIVEVKQARTMQYTRSVQVLKSLRQRPTSGSKYCLAGTMLWPQERNNRLLPTLRHVRKICGSPDLVEADLSSKAS